MRDVSLVNCGGNRVSGWTLTGDDAVSAPTNLVKMVISAITLGCLAAPQSEALEPKGQAMRAYGTEAYHEAVQLLVPAARAGDPEAQLFLGYLYLTGKGVDQDTALAAHWYRLAAEQGNADAQYQLGLMYELGIGLPQDIWEAEGWYQRATDQGFCPGEMRAGGRLDD